MKTKHIALIVFFAFAAIVSCKKSSTKSNPLQGNWNFVSEQVSGQNTIEHTSGGSDYKTVSVSNYTTVGNVGTLNITSNMLNASGISYFISDTITSYDYQDGALLDSSTSIQTQYVQPMTYSLGYVQVGSDSLYFPSGSFMSPSGVQSSGPGGAKINISGDSVLTMTTYFSKDSSIFLYGMPATLNIQATLSSKFRK